MKIGDVYYEKHTVTAISKRTNTVSETKVEIVNMVPIDMLDKIREEIKDNTYFINETTEKEGIDFETVEKIIDKYKAEA